jgi:hypothetical protein
MQLTTMKHGGGLALSWHWMWLALGVLLAAWPACGLGQDHPATAGASENALFGEQYSGRSGQAFGGLVRGGFVTGPGIGRDDGFAPLEFMPYFFADDSLIFGDLRGFRSTADRYGFNTGLGYRRYVRSWDRILGVNFFYDYDNTSSQLFRQIGFGLETYGEMWDMRLNTYFPVTEDTKQLRLDFLPASLRYSGNNILFDQVRTFGVHMKGVDHELGVPLPGRIPERHNARGYAGWYHFQGDAVDSVWGWKGRLQADVISNVNLALEVTNDSVFDTNVIFSVAISYGGFKQPEGVARNQFDRMTTPIQRQYTAVIQKNPVLEADLVALKPDGTPYFVEHVASEPPYNRNNTRFDPTAALGTFENPFFTIQEAQANPGGDIIFAWTNSVFDNMPVTIESGVQTLGEADGVVHTFLLQPFGFVNLPRANNNLDPNVAELRPLLTNIVGDAVTLSSGIALPNGGVIRSEFSGFRIGDQNDPTTGPTGNGIVGDNVTGVDVRFNEINFAGLDGILLNGVGELAFARNQVFNAAGNGLHVVGGAPRIVFEGDGDAATAELFYDRGIPGGEAVLIENTQAGSLVNLFGTSPSAINYTNAGGVRIINANGSARLGDITLVNTVNSQRGAIDIFNSTGAYTFSSPIAITNPSVDAINIEQMAGQTTFQGPVAITNRQQRGLDFQFNSGNILFTNTQAGVSVITNNLGTPSTESAVEYQGSSGNVTFNGRLAIDGGDGDGIVIGTRLLNMGNPIDNTGAFRVNGATSINNILQRSLHIVDDRSAVQFSDFSIDDRGVTLQRNGFPGMLIEDMFGNVNFTGITTIGNSNTSFDIAAQFMNNSGNIIFNQFSINDASAPAFIDAVAGLDIRGTGGIGSYTGAVSISNLDITSINGKALFASAVGDQAGTPPRGGLFTASGTIDSTFESAIDVRDSVIGLLFNSVSSTQSQGPGIFLRNNIVGGRVVAFAVDPGNDVVGAGGDIIQSLTVGAADTDLGNGAFFQNTGIVSLRSMNFIQNTEHAVIAQNVLPLGTAQPTIALSMQTMTFTQNGLLSINGAAEGVLTTNIPNVSIVNALFTQNGGNVVLPNGLIAVFPEIRLQANVAPDDIEETLTTYNFLIDNVTINQGAADATDAIQIRNFNGGPDTPLVLTVTDNVIGVPDPTPFPAAANMSGLQVSWNGPIAALVQNNIIQNFQNTGNAIEVQAGSLFDTAFFEIRDNQIQIVGDNTRGVVFNSAGPSRLLMDNNLINMSGVNAFGTNFTLAADSITTLTNNAINVQGDGGRGFVFTSIADPALVIFDNNAITLNGLFGGAFEIGIDFQSTLGVINFAGQNNNAVTINGIQASGFPWFNFPVGGQFNGSFLLNNVLQP